MVLNHEKKQRGRPRLDERKTVVAAYVPVIHVAALEDEASTSNLKINDILARLIANHYKMSPFGAKHPNATERAKLANEAAKRKEAQRKARKKTTKKHKS